VSDRRSAVELVVELDPNALPERGCVLVDRYALARVREEYARLGLAPQSGDRVRWELAR
jgi:hypothetical protein